MSDVFSDEGKRKKRRAERAALGEQRTATRSESARQEQLFGQFQIPALQGLQRQVGALGDTSLLRQRAGFEGLEDQLRGGRERIRKLFLGRNLGGKEARSLADLETQGAVARSQFMRDLLLGDEQRLTQLLQSLAQGGKSDFSQVLQAFSNLTSQTQAAPRGSF